MLQSLIQTGLSSEEVAAQRQEFGTNQIPSPPPPSDWYFFITQFKNPLVLVLLAAMTVTLFLREWSNVIVIGMAVVVNTVLGFIQERKAYKTLDSLRHVLTPHAWVLRDNEERRLLVEEIVPGDVVLLKQGDKVPADGVVVKCMDCWINEAVVTGESQPVQKDIIDLSLNQNSDDIRPQSLPELVTAIRESKLADDQISLFMGTVVTTGSVTMLVTTIGKQTLLGQIAQGVQQQTHKSTPLEKKLQRLASWLTIMVVILAISVFVLGLLSGRQWVEMFTTTVALAVAAIPEGLVVSLTAVLALGMYRILQRKAVVKHLMAAETLGSVSTICLDKTGTLTEGKLKVVKTDLTNQQYAQLAAVLANDRRDPLDIARRDWAHEQAQNNTHLLTPEQIEQQSTDAQLLSFSTERRFVAAQNKRQVYVVGAPEVILDLCNLAAADEQQYQQELQEWAERGWRVIAFAHQQFSAETDARAALDQLKADNPTGSQLVFNGLMAFSDPVREGIAAALEMTRTAGIHSIVITGDYLATARTIMAEVGIAMSQSQSITGEELQKLTDEELDQKIDKIVLYARTKPSQKLKIVKKLQKSGRVVAMMGDGVNDAPALSAADIGIVVEGASEVAQEAADLVLLNNNFHIVLAAIEEGRLIFQNLRKIALYLLSDTFSELILVVGSILLQLPLPITAAQILWINFIDDGLPNLALTLDPQTEDVLHKPPIKPGAPIVDQEVRFLIGLISFFTGGGLLLLFRTLSQHYGLVTAQSIIFTTLSLDSLVYVFSCRSLSSSIVHDPPWNNWWLVAASVAGVGLTIAALHIPLLQSLFGLTPLPQIGWLIAIGMSVSLIVVIEIVKYVWFHVVHPKTQGD